MKKIMIMLVSVLVVFEVSAQEFNVSGDVAYYSKNLSTFTGLMFSEEPAMVAHMNAGINYKDFNFSASYSGQLGIQHLTEGDRFHMLDLSAGYMVSEKVGLCAGYELAYTDSEQDELGHGVFAMCTYAGNKVSSNLIFFADPKIQNTYYIGSVNVEMMKNVSLYVLGGYTNTKSTPWYGLVGVKYSMDSFFVGTYCVLDKENTGPVVSVGMKF